MTSDDLPEEPSLSARKMWELAAEWRSTIPTADTVIDHTLRLMLDTLESMRVMAIDVLISCEGIEWDRMSSYHSRDGTVSSGIAVDGVPACIITTTPVYRHEKSYVEVSLTFLAQWAHLNVRR